MAVPEQTPYSEHTGNGVTTSFALNFDCESKDHLIVLVNEVEPPIATWSLSGGNVVFTTAPASGSKITLQRNTPFSRTVDYQSYNNSFRPQSVNGDFDRLWLKLQELGVADWLMKLYVDRLHQQQEDKIDNLKAYVDDRDDELRAYLMEEIRKQGVALDQLDEYYNYLMQRLAQIAVDKGWDASFVVDGTQTQKEINLFGGKKYDMPVGGYPLNARVLLDNGDTVRSTISNNINDPNVNMTGWIFSDVVKRAIAFPSVLDNPKVKGDGVSDDSVALQEYFRYVDDNRKSAIFFPLQNHNYLINSAVVVQEPTTIYGDAGATYNRGIGKDGSIIIDGDYAFNLGNGRTYSSTTQDIDQKLSKNPADNWVVKNIAFKQVDGSEFGTKIGIKHDSATNGPDRGFIMREVSGTGLLHVLHGVDHNVQTHLATLVIESCCLSNNILPINMEGNVFGARIVGNQIEQNGAGCIHGVFHARLTVHDNMLEGSGNTIYIKDHPQDRNGVLLDMQGNYFEANYGDYLVKIESFQGNNVYSRGNYVSGFLKDDGVTPNTDYRNQPTDHFLLKNIYNSIYIYDKLSCTFFDWAIVADNNNLDKFLIYAKHGASFTINAKYNESHHVDSTVSVDNLSYQVQTNLGNAYLINFTNGFYSDLGIKATPNAVIQISATYYSESEDGEINTLSFQQEDGVIIDTMTVYGIRSNGQVKSFNQIITLPSNTDSSKNLMIKFNSSSEDIAKRSYILGISAKELGIYSSGATVKTENRFIARKSAVKVHLTKDPINLTIDQPSGVINANSSIQPSTTVKSLSGSDFISISSTYINANLSYSVRPSSQNTVFIEIKNNSATSITVPSGNKLKISITN